MSITYWFIFIQSMNSSNKQENTVFVGGISWKATEDDLKKCFSKYGEVIDVKIIIDKSNNNQSKGFGFVEFKDTESCEKVKKEGFVQLFGKNVSFLNFKFLKMNVGDAVRGKKNGNSTTTQPYQNNIFYPQSNSQILYLQQQWYQQWYQQYYYQQQMMQQQIYQQYYNQSQQNQTQQNTQQQQIPQFQFPFYQNPYQNQQYQMNTVQSFQSQQNQQTNQQSNDKNIDGVKYQYSKPFQPSNQNQVKK